MHSLLDQLTAVLVGGVVLLLLLSGDRRASADSVGAATYYALRQQAEAFGQTVQRDLTALSSPVSVDAGAGSFSFDARITPLSDAESRIVYTLVEVGERDGVMLHRIDRTVDGAASGASPETVVSWAVEGQTDAGAPAATPGDIAQVEAEFLLALPHLPPEGEGATLPDRTRWQATVVPVVLHAATL